MSAVVAPRIESAPRRTEPVSPRTAEGDRCVVLYAVPWDSYVAIREALADRKIFLTYDRGTLEIMTLSFEHESNSGRFGQLIQALADHFRKDYCKAGCVTLQR